MKCEVIQGDCLEVMRTMPPASVDACITDPPYGTTGCSWDSVIPFAPMWVELKRIVKPKGAIVLFGSQPFTSALVMSNPAMFKYEWIWEKNTATGMCQAESQPMRYHESLLVFYEKQPVFNKQMARRKESAVERARYPVWLSSPSSHIPNLRAYNTVQYDPEFVNPKSTLHFDAVPNGTGERYHPTQKPVDLLRYLVRTYTNEGDTVLDFTCGSGTTGVACAIEGRNSINIDSDAHYCEVARARIQRAQGIGVNIPKRVKQYAPTPLFESVAC